MGGNLFTRQKKFRGKVDKKGHYSVVGCQTTYYVYVHYVHWVSSFSHTHLLRALRFYRSTLVFMHSTGYIVGLHSSIVLLLSHTHYRLQYPPASRSLKAMGLGMQEFSCSESTVPTRVKVRWRMFPLMR